MKARALTIALALVVAAVGLTVPAGAAAKPGYYVTRPSRVAQARTRGTHGYQLGITDYVGGPEPLQVEAFKRLPGVGSAIVVYFGGHVSADGDRIHMSLGKEGVIDAHFVPHKVEEEKLLKGCTGTPNVIEKGDFVGTIEIHGRRGFTRVDTDRLPTTFSIQHRQVCRRMKPSKNVFSVGISPNTAPPENEVQLLAGSTPGRPRFDAVSLRPEKDEEAGFEFGDFGASISLRRHGVDMISDVSVSSRPSTFPLPDPLDPRHVTTVEPAAPFSGSATFELTSRTHAEWSGDLTATLPGFGRVALTGDGIHAGLCEGTACSATLPPGQRPPHTHTAGFLAP